MSSDTIRLIIVCAGGPFVLSVITAWWGAYKARKAAEPIKLKLRNGVWVPAFDRIRFIDRVMLWYGRFAALCVAVGLIGSLVYYLTR